MDDPTKKPDPSWPPKSWGPGSTSGFEPWIKTVMEMGLDHLKALIVAIRPIQSKINDDAMRVPFELWSLLKEVELRLGDPSLNARSARRGAGIDDPSILGRFRKQLGRSLTDYIRERRHETVYRLISASELPLAKIASMLGYAGEYTLSIMMRDWCGATPAEIRKTAPSEEEVDYLVWRWVFTKQGTLEQARQLRASLRRKYPKAFSSGSDVGDTLKTEARARDVRDASSSRTRPATAEPARKGLGDKLLKLAAKEKGERDERLAAAVATAVIRVGRQRITARMNGHGHLLALRISPGLNRRERLSLVEEHVCRVLVRARVQAAYEIHRRPDDEPWYTPPRRPFHGPSDIELSDHGGTPRRTSEVLAALRHHWQETGWSLPELARRTALPGEVIRDLAQGYFYIDPTPLEPHKFHVEHDLCLIFGEAFGVSPVAFWRCGVAIVDELFPGWYPPDRMPKPLIPRPPGSGMMIDPNG